MTFFVSFYKSKPLKTLSTHFANQVTHPDFPLRFPKTKKSLMNEWLNETVEPVTPAGGAVGVGYLGVGEGVPTCYMRSPIASSATRRLSDAASAAPTAGAPAATPLPPPQDAIGSAKKRWLRQAISEEHQQPDGGAAAGGGDLSPSSRPDSPGGGSAVLDYITPLKKRRLARESLSSEQSNDGGTKL